MEYGKFKIDSKLIMFCVGAVIFYVLVGPLLGT